MDQETVFILDDFLSDKEGGGKMFPIINTLLVGVGSTRMFDTVDSHLCSINPLFFFGKKQPKIKPGYSWLIEQLKNRSTLTLCQIMSPLWQLILDKLKNKKNALKKK